MIELNIEADNLEDFPEYVALKQHQIEQAAMRALNKTARWMRTLLSREVAGELNLKVGLVKEALVLIRARRNDLSAGVGLSHRAGTVPAVKLGRPRQNRRGTRVGKHQFDGAFVATMPSGRTGVYKRKGKARLPVRELKIVMTGKIADAMEAMSDHGGIEQFQKNFRHELRYLTRSA